jgi:hypothetical protein
MNTNRVMLQDLFQIAGTATTVNAGNVDAGTQRVVLASDQAVVSIDDNSGSLTVDTVADATDAAAHGASQTGFRVMGTDGTNDQQVSVNATGHVNIADGGNSITVDAPTGTPVAVEIGDGTDTVLVTAAGEMNVIATAQAGVDIGDVTVNNGAGGAAVNIQDGGNSLTVDAPTGTPVNVQIGDATNQATVTAAGELDVIQPASHTRNEVFAQSLAIGGELDDAATTAATEGNVSPARITAQRGLHVNLRDDAGVELGTTAAPVGIQIGDGTDTATVTAGGELNVIATAQPSVDIGDVTINNAAAGAAVNIQDGGNSITVDAPVGTPANVQIGDGSDTALVTAAGELNVIATAQPGVDIGDVDIGSVIPVTATGTLTAPSQSVTIDVGGYGSVAIQLSGTWTATVGFDGTVDGTNWVDLQVVPTASTTAVLTSSANGIWYVNVGGLNQIRAFADAHSSGTVDVDLQANIASGKGVVAAGAAGGTSETDDAVFTGGSSSVTPMGAIFDATPPTITDGSVGAPRMNTDRVMLQDLFQVGGVATSVDAGNTDTGTQRVVVASDQASLTVDAPTGTPVNVQIGDGTDTAAVTASNELNVIATAQAGVDIGDVTVNNATGNPASVEIGDGTDTVLVTAAGEMNVLASAQPGTDIGDVTVNNTAGASAVFVQGQAAHDAAVAGNPVVMGGRSNANEPTAVTADNEAVWAWMDRFGRQVTVAGHPSPEAPNTTNVTASGNTSLIATPGASLSLYIKKGSVHNTDSSTVVVQLKDGSAGTVRWQAELATDGGGSLFDFGDVGWKLTANTALFANLSGAGDVNFNITEYYISA